MNRKKIIHHTKNFIKSSLWFLVGAILGIFFLVSFGYIIFQKNYSGEAIPGVFVGNINLEEKNKIQIENYYNQKNQNIQNTIFTFYYQDKIATVSAKDLNIGYDSNLIATQAISIGHSPYFFSNIIIIINAYFNGLVLQPSYTLSQTKLNQTLSPIIKSLTLTPIDAKFVFKKNKVTTFQPSTDGQDVNLEKLQNKVTDYISYILAKQKNQNIKILIPVQVIKPKITTNNANTFGIKELIGSGTSLFQDSIASRIYNIELAANRINGTIVAPNQIFSFDQTLGDISAFTGYKQAYVIQNGHTVLGDGGGVCQVSTTLFRAILNSGLSVIERHAHAYRVGYYEEDSPPGFDATIYVPTVDLKFRNDTKHSILIQAIIDPNNLRLTFNFYGTSDGRQVKITTPIVTNQIPAPTPVYTNDPALAKGKIEQTDFAANGATVSFTRTVTRNNKVILQDTYTSIYQPWQAQYLVGAG